MDLMLLKLLNIRVECSAFFIVTLAFMCVLRSTKRMCYVFPLVLSKFVIH